MEDLQARMDYNFYTNVERKSSITAKDKEQKEVMMHLHQPARMVGV